MIFNEFFIIMDIIIHSIQYVVRISWIIAILLTLLRLYLPSLDKLTSYGKFSLNKASGVSFHIINRRFIFQSSYVIGFIWNSLILICYYFQFNSQWLILFIGILYNIHLLRRIYECIYVHLFSQEEMNIINLLFVWAYYIFAPLSLHFDMLNYHQTDTPFYLLILIGCTLFLIGSIIQYHSHIILRALRKHNNDRNYKIPPSHGFFKYVTSPHYFGEIMIYFGFLFMSQFKYPGPILLFTFVFITLSSQAKKTDQWYKHHFKDRYPKNRKIIIPFIY